MSSKGGRRNTNLLLHFLLTIPLVFAAPTTRQQSDTNQQHVPANAPAVEIGTFVPATTERKDAIHILQFTDHPHEFLAAVESVVEDDTTQKRAETSWVARRSLLPRTSTTIGGRVHDEHQKAKPGSSSAEEGLADLEYCDDLIHNPGKPLELKMEAAYWKLNPHYTGESYMCKLKTKMTEQQLEDVKKAQCDHYKKANRGDQGAFGIMQTPTKEHGSPIFLLGLTTTAHHTTGQGDAIPVLPEDIKKRLEDLKINPTNIATHCEVINTTNMLRKGALLSTIISQETLFGTENFKYPISEVTDLNKKLPEGHAQADAASLIVPIVACEGGCREFMGEAKDIDGPASTVKDSRKELKQNLITHGN